jgi:imidazoleglycerol-phosphate dehydratase
MTADSDRSGQVHRRTKETDINMNLALDGQGVVDIASGVSFIDHMLTLFAVHGFFNLRVKGSGDVEIDDHHTVEDLGICLGQCFKKALGDLSGISRYGCSTIPMDEALARVAVDISNRPYLYYAATIKDQKVGSFDTSLVKEFLRAFSQHGGITLHVEVLHGENAHHIIEAIFKALGRALGQASSMDERVRGPLSSKGSL